MKKTETIKEPVRIREKVLKDGNRSLYLDIYRDGKRKYEFLKLYLIPEKTRADKERNKQTMQLANSIKAQRIVELQNGVFGFRNQYADNTLFFDYYRAMCEKRLGSDSQGNWGNWRSALKHLEHYEKNHSITHQGQHQLRACLQLKRRRRTSVFPYQRDTERKVITFYYFLHNDFLFSAYNPYSTYKNLQNLQKISVP